LQSSPTQLALDDAITWLRQQLEDEEIDEVSNFLGAGGHSIMAIQLRQQLRERYGIDLQLPCLFRDSVRAAVESAKPWNTP
jgi:aryl carrier-like protein